VWWQLKSCQEYFPKEENLAVVSSDRNNAVCCFWFNVSWTEISKKKFEVRFKIRFVMKV